MPYFGPGGIEVRIDYKGLGDVMRGPTMQGIMAEAANALARELLSRGVDRVFVDTYTTDRGAAAVTIPDYDAQGAEAKYGILSEAALSLGLEVKRSAGD